LFFQLLIDQAMTGRHFRGRVARDAPEDAIHLNDGNLLPGAFKDTSCGRANYPRAHDGDVDLDVTFERGLFGASVESTQYEISVVEWASDIASFRYAGS